jgi:hypothetical protein
VDEAIDTTLRVLEEPLNRRQIADRVCRSLGVQRQDVHGGGWGGRRKIAAVPVGELVFPVVDLLHLVAARGVVCYGPYLGNEPTFVRADAWIPNWKDMPRPQAEDLLLEKYLHAFGPATINDFTMWAGITLKDAKEIWARQRTNIIPVNVEGWAANILEKDINELSKVKLEPSVTRLLPYFDTFLLGHRGRDHLASAEHRAHIYRAQGWISPVVLVNGRATAVWEYSREGSKLRVKVLQFGPFSRQIRSGIQEEIQDLSRFLGTSSVNIQFD